MGSAGSKGRGFQRVRVTEREDCLAVWKHERELPDADELAVTECEDCLAVWKLKLISDAITVRINGCHRT